MGTEKTEIISYTAYQAAKITGLSKYALQRLRQSGGGPEFVHAGHRTILYRREALERWLAERSRRSTSDPGGTDPSPPQRIAA